MLYWGFLTDIFDKSAADRRNFEPEHNEFMQFTGLLDKNGKEIYEGDIVSQFIAPNPYDYGKVEYQKSSFIVSWTSLPWQYLEVLSEKIEIIGNIYENRELLNK